MRRSYGERRFPAFFPDCALPLACGLKAMLLHAPVQRAAAQSEGFGGLANVSLKALQSFANEDRFHSLEAEFFQIGRLRTLHIQSQVCSLDLLAPTHEHGALYRVIEFPDVAGPRVLRQVLQREFFEALDLSA